MDTVVLKILTGISHPKWSSGRGLKVRGPESSYEWLSAEFASIRFSCFLEDFGA